MTTILLTGKTGQLGWELTSTLANLGRLVALGRGEIELDDPDSIRHAIRDARPDIIVNAAGYTTVDRAESEPDLVMRVNATAPGIIAEEAKRLNALLVHYSTDYVYDGTQERPYVEDDPTRPVNIYGKSKLAGDRAIQATGARSFILRTSWIYGERRPNFVRAILAVAREKPEVAVVDDQMGSPSSALALSEATVELLRRRERAPEGGIFHLSAAGHVTRHDFAVAIVNIMREAAGHEGWARITPIPLADYPQPAQRPRRPITSKEKLERVFGIAMPHWSVQLRRFLAAHSVPALPTEGVFRGP
jgi:dTDP-4-dehydrorhamnose reductase